MIELKDMSMDQVAYEVYELLRKTKFRVAGKLTLEVRE